MDQRMIEFIAGLRGAGVRISVAESADAMRAVEQIGISDKELFRTALQASLIKEARDLPLFQNLFPLYFGGSPPPMQQPGGGGSMNEKERQMLQYMLQHMLENMSPEQLARLFEAMMLGQQMSQEQLRQMANQRMPFPSGRMPLPQMQEWARHSAMRNMHFDELEQMLAQLLDRLRDAGLSEEALQDIEQTALQNKQSLQEQLEQQLDQQMVDQMQQQRAAQGLAQDMMDRPFEQLNEREVEELRHIVTQLAARLRSRIALRQRRSKSGTLDAKQTIRTNLRFGGVPMNVRYRRRHLKPKITIICDLSYSMRPVTSFTLLLIYALQDQISRTRSFAFIDDLTDISTEFAELRPEHALETIQYRIRPPYSYATDLGKSLNTFVRDHLDCLDYRTTFIVLGDGRNNYRDPNLAAFAQIARRVRRVIWFNPEAPHMWGVEYPDTLNSDMLEYARMCDVVHHVSNVRQLIAAVDRLFSPGGGASTG
jgi:hypothetical protein